LILLVTSCAACVEKKSVRYISAKHKKIHSGITRNGKKEVGFNNIGNIIFEKLRKNKFEARIYPKLKNPLSYLTINTLPLHLKVQPDNV